MTLTPDLPSTTLAATLGLPAGLPAWWFLGTLAALGLAIGSFLTVVISRVPQGHSIVTPASACPRCNAKIRPYDNIPVLSWLLLRGKCRGCRAPIGALYPAVESVTAVLFVAAGLWLGWSSFLPATLVMVSAGVALAVIDVQTMRLPDPIVATTYLLLAAALAVDVVVEGWPGWTPVWSMVAWGGLYAFLCFGSGGRAMGFGDVKLAPALGLYLGWLGWGASLVGLLGGFVLGSVVGSVVLLIGRRFQMRAKVPFGPYMIAAAAAAAVVGGAAWTTYLETFNV